MMCLQVQSHLENSKFHLHQSQSQQVKQYMTLGSKLASSAAQGHAMPHPHTPGQPIATVPILRNGHMPPVSDSSNPNSPVTLLTMANTDSEVSVEQDCVGTEARQSQNVPFSGWKEVKLKQTFMTHSYYLIGHKFCRFHNFLVKLYLNFCTFELCL